MTEQSLFVLAALARGERHGYGIAQDSAALSDGRISLTAGTLYGVLSRLTSDGLIEQTREETVEGRRRRYYRITAAGESALAAETARLRSIVAVLGSQAPLRAGPTAGLA